MPDFDEIMKMAQQAQADLQKAQAELDNIEVNGAAGGGMVTIRATAKGRIIGVSIDESLLQPSEKTMLEDLVAAALNDARAKADIAANEQMQKVTSSLPMPSSASPVRWAEADFSRYRPRPACVSSAKHGDGLATSASQTASRMTCLRTSAWLPAWKAWR